MNYNSFLRTLFFFILIILCINVFAQEGWPRTLKAKNGSEVTIYQPQPERLDGNRLTGRTAFSAKEKPGDEPVFGALFFTAMLNTNRDTRIVTLESIRIDNVKLSGVDDTSKINKLKTFLETEIPKWEFHITIDEILTSIEKDKNISSANLKNDPPKIIYRATSSTLITIDGEAHLKDDDKLKMKRVMNSAFLIVQYPKDNQYYLYGGNFWYQSANITSGYTPVKKLPKELQDIDTQIKAQAKKDGTPISSSEADQPPPEIIVSTEAAELIQSTGEANYSTISGTQLLYVSNSDDHIFKDISSNKNYVLLSGRWYTAPSLNGPWSFIESDKLPDDFKKIPDGSDQDIVLASVAGTEEAKEAVMDAQIPQTAKVDRKEATCSVKYDGDPDFAKIEGTSLSVALNTSSNVLQSGKNYYCVENGVWFKAASPNGPWAVSDERPQDVEKIPADNSAYNTQYVYIYQTTPQYVYVGYTPGYMNCYVYGGVVVYGTGYYYSPWYGPYYYPKPVTYGYSMHYNPYTGWSMGYHYSSGYFSYHVYVGDHPGYWGPPMYRPPYYPPYHGGMYGHNGPTYVHNGDVNINVDRSNNIYNGNKGVSTNDVKRNQQGNVSTNDVKKNQGGNPSANNKAGNQPNQNPATGNKQNPSSGTNQNPNAARPSTNQNNRNNVATDKQGNVYKQNDQGNWDQKSTSGWQQNNNANTQQQLNKQQQQQQQGQERNNNYNQTNQGGNMGGGAGKTAGGVRRK